MFYNLHSSSLAFLFSSHFRALSSFMFVRRYQSTRAFGMSSFSKTRVVAVFVKEVGGLTKMSSPLSEDDSEVADRSPRCRCGEWGLAALTLDKIFW